MKAILSITLLTLIPFSLMGQETAKMLSKEERRAAAQARAEQIQAEKEESIEEEKIVLPVLTVRSRLDAGLAIKTESADSNDESAGAFEAELTGSTIFDKKRLEYGLRARLQRNGNLGDSFEAEGDLLARLHLSETGHLRGSFEGFTGVGTNPLLDVYVAYGLGGILALCSLKEPGKKLELCVVGDGKVTVLHGANSDAGGKIELNLALNLRKKLTDDVAIFHGPRVGGAYYTDGATERTDKIVGSVTYNLGLEWDRPKKSDSKSNSK